MFLNFMWIQNEIYSIVYDKAWYVVCDSMVHCRTLLGSVGDDVLHNVHCPVIIVRLPEDVLLLPKPSRKVVIAVDDSKEVSLPLDSFYKKDELYYLI